LNLDLNIVFNPKVETQTEVFFAKAKETTANGKLLIAHCCDAPYFVSGTALKDSDTAQRYCF
jgi:hypothetical protein